MELKEIVPGDLILPATSIWLERWFALTSGTEKSFNSMTIAWGSIGVMWGEPFIQVVVRPGRHTFKFMEEFDSFTVCSFPAENKSDLSILGSKSGRDCDKIAETKLTIMKSKVVSAPCFKEADLIIECKKIYWQDMNHENFLSDKIMKNYPQYDFHRIYFGKIQYVRGIDEFRKK